MMNIVAVALGGATGSLLRYGVILLTIRIVGALPYYATLTVNLVGCCVMGLFAELILTKETMPESFKLLATTGLLGGFTTFSAFSFDTGRLINDGSITTAFLYVIGSVGGGIAAFFAGLYLARLT